MKTATVSELRDRPAELLDWSEAGEEVVIHRDDVVIARLVPEKPMPSVPATVDWSQSATFRRDKSQMKVLTQEEVDSVLKDSSSLEASLLPGGWRT